MQEPTGAKKSRRKKILSLSKWLFIGLIMLKTSRALGSGSTSTFFSPTQIWPRDGSRRGHNMCALLHLRCRIKLSQYFLIIKPISELCANSKHEWPICFYKKALRAFNKRNKKRGAFWSYVIMNQGDCGKNKMFSHEHVAETTTYQQLSGERAREHAIQYDKPLVFGVSLV